VDHVVCVAPPWGTSAAGKGAALVPDDEGSADPAADRAPFASDVEDLTCPVEDDGYDFGVTGQAPHVGRAELGAVVEHAGAAFGPQPVAELVVVDGDDDLGSVPAVAWQLAAGVDQLAHLHQGVGAPLSWGAGILLVFFRPWGAQRVECGA
jgi:hypothetical protein